jgi:hypothetical protein
MRRAIVFVVGAVLLALALLITAPATLVDNRLDTLSAGSLRLANANGTLWNGTGELRLVPGAIAVPVVWHVDGWHLLLGELRGTLSGSDNATPASFLVSPSESSVRNVTLTLPADAVLHAFGAPVSLVTAGGDIGLRIGELSRRGDRIDGQVALRWDKATLQTGVVGLRPAPRVALGDVRFDAMGHGSEITGMLANSGGDVEITGTVSASVGGAARVNALVRPRAGIDAESANAIGSALAAVGQPDATGGYRITWVQ